MPLKNINIAAAILWCLAGAASLPAQTASQNVVTYHVDPLRTGWFHYETQLTAANVNSTSFGLQTTVTLDGRVDAEPLVVFQQTVTGQGVHDVVYVATENNSVYAIDAESGAILWQVNFGTPVPYEYKDYDDNVYPVMGILGTPVIDRSTGTLYVVADIYNGTSDSFELHAISLASGADLLTPVTIGFTDPLAGGGAWTFNSQYQLQRPGLLEANGSIYVAFGSNGDINPNISRGSILRYDKATLALQSSNITDHLSLSESPYYLSSIWQSGYAPAADTNGDIYFATGNSDPSEPTYSKYFNRPESVLRLSPNLNDILTSFTPNDYFNLDQGDADLGSAGTLVLPNQTGTYPHLAVAGGKDGRAFLLNRDNLGGYTPGGPDDVLQTVTQGSCWCGPAYFVGSDSIPRVVTGGGNGVTTWQLLTSPTTQLVAEFSTGSGAVSGLPDNGGSIPVISSNGTTANSAIIWFVQKPSSSSDSNPGTPLTLMAFAATNLSQPLVSIPAGAWTHAVNSNANIIPTVANGRVYVASNLQLQIFGLLAPQAKARGGAVLPAALMPSAPGRMECPPNISPLTAFGGEPGAGHVFYGKVCSASNAQLTLALRSGHSVPVDISTAAALGRPLLSSGRAVRVQATIDSQGVAHAQRISPAHTFSAMTPADH